MSAPKDVSDFNLLAFICLGILWAITLINIVLVTTENAMLKAEKNNYIECEAK